MREIKFRVWNGLLHEYRTIDMNSGKQNLGMGFEATEGIGSNITTIYHSVGDVIEQYTGLKDQDGVEIFENDIVKTSGANTYVVEYFDGKFNPVSDLEGSNWEVIGNIHDQPELLESLCTAVDITFSEKFKQYSRKGNIDGQTLYKFPNGFGASVVFHIGSYGYEQGLCEIAVISWLGEEWEITYSTSVTDDVIGYLDSEQRDRTLEDIFNL